MAADEGLYPVDIAHEEHVALRRPEGGPRLPTCHETGAERVALACLGIHPFDAEPLFPFALQQGLQDGAPFGWREHDVGACRGVAVKGFGGREDSLPPRHSRDRCARLGECRLARPGERQTEYAAQQDTPRYGAKVTHISGCKDTKKTLFLEKKNMFWGGEGPWGGYFFAWTSHYGTNR